MNPDLREGKQDDKGDSKYVVSVENELEKSDWMEVITKKQINPRSNRLLHQLNTYHQVTDVVFEDDKTLDDYNIRPYDTIYYDIK